MRFPAVVACASLLLAAQGCGSSLIGSVPQGQDPVSQAFSTPADPFREISAVAHQIWEEMDGDTFEGRFQVVSGARSASPKYAFLNQAIDQTDGSTLYRAGTYAISTRKTTVAVSLLDSPATRRNAAEVPEVASAVKQFVRTTYERPVTKLILNTQGPGRDKYSFLAISENQPESSSGMVWTWYYVGTYAVGSKTASVRIACGSGRNTSDSYTIDRRGGDR